MSKRSQIRKTWKFKTNFSVIFEAMYLNQTTCFPLFMYFLLTSKMTIWFEKIFKIRIRMLLTQFLSIFFGSYRFVRVKSNVRCELGPRHSWCNRLETQLFYEESRNLSMQKKINFWKAFNFTDAVFKLLWDVKHLDNLWKSDAHHQYLQWEKLVLNSSPSKVFDSNSIGLECIRHFDQCQLAEFCVYGRSSAQ